MPEYTERQFKSILNRRKYIDSWFWDRYGVTPYNGCVHDCIYCDSRSRKYYMPDDFGNNIIVKMNVGEMLDKRLSGARRLLPDVIGIGGTSDGFQPCERKFGNTGKILEVLKKHRYPVFIATKSAMVTEYKDILDDIARDTWASVGLTITHCNDGVARFLEPNAAPVSERFKAIEKLKRSSSNILAGVLFIPVVIGFSDNKGVAEDLFRRAKDSGADYILFGGGATMRDNQAVYFLNKLKDNYQDIIHLYEEVYGFTYTPDHYDGNYGSGWEYTRRLHENLFGLCEKYGLPFRMKRFIPDDFRKTAYEVSEILLNNAYRKQMLGIECKDEYWAGINIQNLDTSLEVLASKKALRSIRSINIEIEQFILKHIPHERTPLTLF